MLTLLVLFQFINNIYSDEFEIFKLRHNWDNNRPLVSPIAKGFYELQNNKCTENIVGYGMNNYGKILDTYSFNY
jgi:hypothetical protein